MAQQPRRTAAGFQQLPGELIRRIYSFWFLTGAKHRLRGLAVSKQFHQALAHMPFSFHVSRRNEEQLRWMIAFQPKVFELSTEHELTESAESALLPAAILAVRESIEALHLCGQLLPEVLLVPAALTRLRTLDARGCSCPTDWVGQLSALIQLRDLDLCLNAPDAPAAAAEFPSLPALSCLTLELPGGATVRVCLPHLPALRSVRALGDGMADLTSPGSGISTAPASHLTGLYLLNDQARVDLALMPALQSAEIQPAALEGAATIAAASTLTELQLGTEAYYPLEWPWVAELLWHLPGSVEKLGMSGTWSGEAAEALGCLTQLRALYLAGDNPPMPAGDAPLWRGLTALDWADLSERAEHVGVPPGLRGAPRLEVLWLRLPLPTVRELELLCTLPSLRRLNIYRREEDEATAAATTAVVARLLPQVTYSSAGWGW